MRHPTKFDPGCRFKLTINVALHWRPKRIRLATVMIVYALFADHENMIGGIQWLMNLRA